MHNTKKILTGFLLSMFMLGSLAMPAQAQTTDVAALQAQVQALLDQINQLNAQMLELQQKQKEVVTEFRATINELQTQLRVGSEGDEVEDLQEFLASFPDLYPEGLVTGYFGPLTEKAVKKFQKKYGIEQVGEVGPKTRAQFNALIREKIKNGTLSREDAKDLRDDFKDKYSNSGKGSFDFDDDDDDMDDDSDDDDDDEYKKGNGHNKLAVCHKGSTKYLPAPAVSAHLLHGDSLGECGEDSDDSDDDDDIDDDTSTTTDMVAPVISNIGYGVTGTTSVKVSWTTDEAADSKLYYSTTTPVMAASAMMKMDSSLVTNHSFDLMDLSTSTPYYYFVTATDAAGNTSISTEQTFQVN